MGHRVVAMDGQRTTRNPYCTSAISSRCKPDRLPRYNALGGAVGSACPAPAGRRTAGLERTRETPNGTRLRRRGLSAALSALSFMHRARCSCRWQKKCSRQQGPPAGCSGEALSKTEYPRLALQKSIFAAPFRTSLLASHPRRHRPTGGDGRSCEKVKLAIPARPINLTRPSLDPFDALSTASTPIPSFVLFSPRSLP
jgi:hypothetical protein